MGIKRPPHAGLKSKFEQTHILDLDLRQMFHEDLNFQQTLQTSTMWMYAISKREMIYFGLDEYFFSVSWEIMEIELLLAVDSK